MPGPVLNSDPSVEEQRCHRFCGALMPATAFGDLCTWTVEKQIREEEVWRQQENLQDSIFRFQDWLGAAEVVAASPESSQVSYAASKKELQRFQVLQRQISDKALPLESLNRQYHQLARTAGSGLKLRSTMRDINWRWEGLQTRAAAVSRRLKHFVRQWEAFEQEKETIQLWLMELDLRLTDVEHFSGGTWLEKMTQLQAFQQDVQANADHVDRLLGSGKSLIWKSQPEDAEIVEENLQELIGFFQAVFRKVFQFRRRLVSLRLVFEDEWESDRDSDLESDCITEGSSLEFLKPCRATEPTALTCGVPQGQSTPEKGASDRQQQPPSRDLLAMDLEWDPSVDIGGSTSPEEEDSSYSSAIMGQVDSLRQRCRSVPLDCDDREEPSMQSHFQKEWKQFSCSLENQLKRDSSGRLSQQIQGASQPPSCLLARRGSCCQGEPAGYTPKGIETWLDQICPEKGLRIEGCLLPAAGALQLPPEMQTRGHQTKGRKSQQQTKKTSKRTLIPSPPLLAKGQQISMEALLRSQAAEMRVTIEKERDPLLPAVISVPTQKPRRVSALWLLLIAALVLVLVLTGCSSLSVSETSCLQRNGFAKSFHLMLTYDGPPPI